MLLGWSSALLVLTIRAASNGISGIWRTPVTEHPGWSKNATSPYGQPSTTTYPTRPSTNYGSPAPGQPQPNYGMPQQGYGIPPPQQHGYPSPQPQYGAPAPGSPYGAPQQMGYAGQPAQPYPAYPQPQ